MPPADARDVVAETFLVCWRRLQRVPEGRDARLWLYGVARRVLANHDRAERRRARLRGRMSETVQAAAQGVESTAHGGAVAKAFARLRSGDRELLALVAWEGLGAREIARVIGCSENAARIRLHRARHRFAQELETENEDPMPRPRARAALALREEEAR
jgi:RNA polymerase sigma-70 factor (ECF subfamily)